MLQFRADGLSQYNTSDTLIATEAAAQVWMQGQNPYAADFTKTELGVLAQNEEEIRYWNGLGLENNPALHHFAYFPSSFVIPSLIFYVTGYFDLRWLFAVILFLGLLLVFFLFKDHDFAELLVAGILVLLVYGNYRIGVNDGFVLGLMLLMIACINYHHHAKAAILLGIMTSMKQTVWPVALLLLIWGFHQKKRAYVWTPLVFLGFTLPFFLWNPSAFLDDTFSYFAGTTAHAYPVNPDNGGLPMLLSMAGASFTDIQSFPFFIIQFIAFVPLLWIVIRRLSAKDSLGTVLMWSGILLFVFSIFYKNFHFNYFFFSIAILFIGGLLSMAETKGYLSHLAR